MSARRYSARASAGALPEMLPLEPTTQKKSEVASSSAILAPTREMLMSRFYAIMSQRTQAYTDLTALESIVKQLETWGWIFDPYPLSDEDGRMKMAG